MPTYIDLEPALLNWQAKHKQRMTFEELARKTGISIAALYRIKSGNMIAPDLRKINAICKILECDPGDLIVRSDTSEFADAEAAFEAERLEVMSEINPRPRKPASSHDAKRQ